MEKIVYLGTEFDRSKTHIDIPFGYTSIGDKAFLGYMDLQSITIGEGVRLIGDSAFHECSSLKKFNVSPSNKMYKTTEDKRCLLDKDGKLVAFAPSGLENYVIPDSVTSIGDSAFHECSSLQSITIGEGVKSIGECAFYRCSSLQSITIPDSVTSIGDDTFYGCSSLKEFNVSPTNKMYKTEEYKRCLIDKEGKLVAFAPSGLENYVIPDSVTSIRARAFYGCPSLKSITIGEGVTSIGYGAFRGCSSLETVIIPKHLTEKEGWEKRIFGDMLPENIEIYDKAEVKTDEGLSK